MRKLGVRLMLVETAHFLIWTDLSRQYHKILADQCEAMYATLQRVFEIRGAEPVFLGKCGVYILSNQEQFKAFSRLTQGITLINMDATTGYCRVLPDNRSRIVAFWPGNTQQLAEVLVHEGTHAFLYRYRRDGAVDRWFNEGLAEHVVGLVFKMRAEEGRGAMQTAAQDARDDPQLLARIMDSESHLPGIYYPVAQSAVAFLAKINPKAFVRLVQDMKDGVTFPDALQKTYNASLQDYEIHWRRWLLSVAQSGRSIY